MIESESPRLDANFGWESLVVQRVEKQIKSKVGADCCTEPNGISSPWGPLHPASVFLLYFQWKWTALRFPTGDQGRRDAVWTQAHTDTWTSAAPGEWTLKHVTAISTIVPYRDHCGEIMSAKETRSRATGEKSEKKEKKGETFFKGESGKQKSLLPNKVFLIMYTHMLILCLTQSTSKVLDGKAVARDFCPLFWKPQ